MRIAQVAPLRAQVIFLRDHGLLPHSNSFKPRHRHQKTQGGRISEWSWQRGTPLATFYLSASHWSRKGNEPGAAPRNSSLNQIFTREGLKSSRINPASTEVKPCVSP